MKIAPAILALVELEREVSRRAAREHDGDECRVYEWRPTGPPELPAIWNWIEPSDVEAIDTARSDDLLLVSVTIGAKSADLPESMGQLLRLTDLAREVLDPAFASDATLGGTALSAKRVTTGNEVQEFAAGSGLIVPVICMSMLIRLQLSSQLHPR